MKIILVFLCMVSFSVAANLLLKMGAVSAEPAHGQITHLLNWRVMLGLVSFAAATTT